MWLLLWVCAVVLIIGVLGGVLGALADRSARSSSSPFGEMVSAYLSGRATAIRSGSKARASSRG
jgi:hypothetical protein